MPTVTNPVTSYEDLEDMLLDEPQNIRYPFRAPFHASFWERGEMRATLKSGNLRYIELRGGNFIVGVSTPEEAWMVVDYAANLDAAQKTK